MMDLVLLGHRFPEHSGLSGYCRIADSIPGCKRYIYVRRKKMNFFQRLITGIVKRLSETDWLAWDNLKCQFDVYREIRKGGRKKLFHFLYGENGFYWAARFAKNHNHFVLATFHCTAETLERMFRTTECFKYLDAVILTSKTQLGFFKKIGYRGKIYIIHHGVNTSYFSPKDKGYSGESLTCITTGFFERDYETIREVAERLESDNRIKFIVISSPGVCRKFAGMKNVKTYGHVPDSVVRRLYRDSDIFLFSVKSATSNNSLLEAMSSGLPVVTENIGGIPEYVTKDCAVCLKKGDIRGMCDVLTNLRVSPAIRARMGLAARARALELDWEKIADKTQEVYKTIFSL